MKNEFKIEILRPHWIEKGDPKDDQCLHSPVFAQVGEEIVSDENSGDWTISATGLYLLRSLSSGHKPGIYASQLLPCCGFNILAIDGFNDVQILGCPNGIDWTIEITGDKVTHRTESGGAVTLDFECYRKTVILFVEKIETYFQTSDPKNIPGGLEDKEGVQMFWKEWGSLKKKWTRL